MLFEPQVYIPNFPARLVSFTVKTTTPSTRICRLDPTATTLSRYDLLVAYPRLFWASSV